MSADGTFFQKMEVRWEDVLKAIGEDGSIPTKQFVEAARGLCKIFGTTRRGSIVCLCVSRRSLSPRHAPECRLFARQVGHGAQRFRTALLVTLYSLLIVLFQAVETRYKADPEKNATLQQLVHSEKIDTPKDQPVTRSLLWFKRCAYIFTSLNLPY